MYWIQHYVIKFVSIILTSCFLHVYVYLEQSQLEYKKIVEGLNCDNKKMPCQNKNKSSCMSNLSHLWIFEIVGLWKEILNSDVQAFHQNQQKETTASHHKPLNKNKQRNHGIWHRRSRSWYILFENIISHICTGILSLFCSQCITLNLNKNYWEMKLLLYKVVNSLLFDIPLDYVFYIYNTKPPENWYFSCFLSQ